MEAKLKEVQKILKAIARSAMDAEFNMDVDLSAGQWNSWTASDLERVLTNIGKYVETAKQFLEQTRGEQDDK